MKKYILLILSAAFCLCAESRIMPLESDISNGCYMQTGILKAHKTLPSQKGRGIINISPASAMSLFFQEDSNDFPPAPPPHEGPEPCAA